MKTVQGNNCKFSLNIFICVIFLFIAGCSSDAEKLAAIIDEHGGNITADEACKKAGFDAERCDKANSIMLDAMTNKIMKGLKK